MTEEIIYDAVFLNPPEDMSPEELLVLFRTVCQSIRYLKISGEGNNRMVQFVTGRISLGVKKEIDLIKQTVWLLADMKKSPLIGANPKPPEDPNQLPAFEEAKHNCSGCGAEFGHKNTIAFCDINEKLFHKHSVIDRKGVETCGTVNVCRFGEADN